MNEAPTEQQSNAQNPNELTPLTTTALNSNMGAPLTQKRSCHEDGYLWGKGDIDKVNISIGRLPTEFDKSNFFVSIKNLESLWVAATVFWGITLYDPKNKQKAMVAWKTLILGLIGINLILLIDAFFHTTYGKKKTLRIYFAILSEVTFFFVQYLALVHKFPQLFWFNLLYIFAFMSLTCYKEEVSKAVEGYVHNHFAEVFIRSFIFAKALGYMNHSWMVSLLPLTICLCAAVLAFLVFFVMLLASCFRDVDSWAYVLFLTLTLPPAVALYHLDEFEKKRQYRSLIVLMAGLFLFFTFLSGLPFIRFKMTVADEPTGATEIEDVDEDSN
jgi:hypothetical protein